MDSDLLNLDFPATIETERLTIRGFRHGDGPAFNAAIVETLEALQTWLGFYRDGPPSVEQTEAFVREQAAKFILREELMMPCFLKGTNIIVASSGLRPFWKTPAFEIGYWCRRAYQGQGYVTEAVTGITDFAFTHLQAKRVFIRCDTDNHASANVARRAGFDLEGTLRHDGRKHNGALRNTLIFSQIRPD
jgi:RimJ/RimL family protein N-acetyltransferase